MQLCIVCIFYDGMYFLWLFWGLVNDENFHFSPTKLFCLWG